MKNPPNESNPCFDSSYCVYDKLFRWIEQAAEAAHAGALTPVLSTFADTDLVLDKITRAGHLAPSVNIWAVQLYRGYSFGPWFEQAANASNTPTNYKPFLVTEYGVDAYHDVCGHDPLQTPCYNQLGDSSGSHEDEGTQALWNRNLTIELGWHSSAQPLCDENSAERSVVANLTGDLGYVNETCVAAGGFIYSWVDEYWKGSNVAAECTPNFWEPAFTLDTCEYKAHVTCPNWNASMQDLCGQPLFSSPDHYQNEEWFGITAPTKCADSMDRCAQRRSGATAARARSPGRRLTRPAPPRVARRRPGLTRSLRLRKSYWALQEEWTGGLNTEAILMPSCEQITACPARCSGHGTCETDHKICGPATVKPNSGAPCCICEPGWAGEQCDQLDARTLLSIGGGFGILLLISAVLLSYGARRARRASFSRALARSSPAAAAPVPLRPPRDRARPAQRSARASACARSITAYHTSATAAWASSRGCCSSTSCSLRARCRAALSTAPGERPFSKSPQHRARRLNRARARFSDPAGAFSSAGKPCSRGLGLGPWRPQFTLHHSTSHPHSAAESCTLMSKSSCSLTV